MSSSEDESGINWENIETIKSFDGSKLNFIYFSYIKKNQFQLIPKQILMEIQQNFKKAQ